MKEIFARAAIVMTLMGGVTLTAIQPDHDLAVSTEGGQIEPYDSRALMDLIEQMRQERFPAETAPGTIMPSVDADRAPRIG